MIWLYGPAGVGKSAIAQTFAEVAKEQKRLGAAFFFSNYRHEEKRRSDPLRLVPTIAYQLASQSSVYQHTVAQQIASDPAIFTTDLQMQFRKLIIEPFVQLSSQNVQLFNDGQGPYVVVIDGLDEANSDEAQRELMELIKTATKKPGSPLIWLVCSRPEPHIAYVVTQPDFATTCGKEELVINESKEDVELFLHSRFREIRHRYNLVISVPAGDAWPSENDFNTIVKEVNGYFVLGSTVVRIVEDPNVGDPEAQLASVLRMLQGMRITGLVKPLDVLDTFYARILRKVSDHILPVTKRILAICAYPDLFSYLNLTTERVQLLLLLRPAEFHNAIRKLYSVVDIPPDEEASERHLTFFHKSFGDYLRDVNRSGNFSISQDQARSLWPEAYDLLWVKLTRQHESSHFMECKSIPSIYSDIWLTNIDLDVYEALTNEFNFGLFAYEADELWDPYYANAVTRIVDLSRDAKVPTGFVRTEAIRDDVADMKLLHHLSLLTKGRRINPLDLQNDNPFEMLTQRDPAAAFFIVGRGWKSALAVLVKGSGKTVAFGREFPDSGRNPRGFAIKHYTEDGNYDVVGLNWPIFFCRDPIQGPDVIRSRQRNPKNFLLDYNSLFDFLANVPESNHAGLMFFSDHGTLRGRRFMHGYGCHTFRWVNNAGQFVYVKYPDYCDEAGRRDFTWPEAVRMSGEEPDFAKRDLWAAIERGETLTWTMKVQLMPPQEADPDKLGFDPFDITKVWSRDRFPVFGRLVLSKNPDDYYRDVEQAAFSPGAMVPGIADSPDPLLQFRMFFYHDAQYHRLASTNIHQIPVNCPFMARSFSTPNFAGVMRCDANTGSNPHYSPNSFIDKYDRSDVETPYTVSDNIVSRQSHFWSEGKPDKEYEQARHLYLNIMNDRERQAVHSNTAGVLILIDYPQIVQKYLGQLLAIDEDYARGVWEMLLDEEHVTWTAVKDAAKTAVIEGKNEKLRPHAKENKHVGDVPRVPVYN
ncbi:Catalase [Leucoagaricus sp. SymC.cos]|nr:Catalase [Leucoagaricus sp. SymC.cos]